MDENAAATTTTAAAAAAAASSGATTSPPANSDSTSDEHGAKRAPAAGKTSDANDGDKGAQDNGGAKETDTVSAQSASEVSSNPHGWVTVTRPAPSAGGSDSSSAGKQSKKSKKKSGKSKGKHDNDDDDDDDIDYEEALLMGKRAKQDVIPTFTEQRATPALKVQ